MDVVGGDGERNRSQAEYRATVDELVARVREERVCRADDAEWKEHLASLPEERRFEASAVRRVKYALQKGGQEGRCPYCWVLAEACYCDDLPELSSAAVQFAVLYHPNEFLRSSSTGKLVCQVLGGELLLFGCHEERILSLALHPDTYVLFPDDDAPTLADLHTLAAAQQHPPPSAGGLPHLTVLVLDGTWSQARMLFTILHRMNPRIKTLRLDLQQALSHESLFNTLRKQSEAGRVSTFEACMLLLADAGEATDEVVELFKKVMVTLAFERHRNCPYGEVSEQRRQASITGHRRRHQECSGVSRLEKRGVKKTTDAELETWIDRIKQAAASLPLPPPVIRHCSHCALYTTPARLAEHLKGRLHAQTVAKKHLARPPGRGRSFAPPGNHERAKLVTQDQADALYGATLGELLLPPP